MSMTFGEKKKKAAYTGYRSLSEEKSKAEKSRIQAKKDAVTKNADGKPTFAYFAAHDEGFVAACQKAGIPATARQASKWFRQRGLAYKNR
ncbi:MAG: hypothetical protein WCI01_12530 [Chlorobiaceae bacterium]